MNKILTLVIPSYNMEKYLDRCLSSLIIDEDHMHIFEALIINDGSKDRTSEIGRRYERNYPGTFRVIDKENGHYGSCVNRGLAEAKGTFIKILDADDSFNTEVFPRFLNFLDSEEAKETDLILSNYSYVRENGAIERDYTYENYNSPITLDSISGQDKMDWFIHGLTYKTQNLRSINYRQSEGILYTDNEWIFNPLVTVKRICQFEGSLYNYTIGREGQSMSPEQRLKNIGMSFQVVKSNLNFFTCSTIEDKAIKAFLFDRLTIEATHLYQLCLFNYNNSPGLSDLLESFDQEMRAKCAPLYEKTDQYSITIGGIRFYPIADWRNNNHKIKLAKILYKIVDWANKLANR